MALLTQNSEKGPCLQKRSRPAFVRNNLCEITNAVLMRHRGVASRGDEVEEEELLEEEEQDEVIQQFERQVARQERYAKQIVGILGLLLATVYLVFSIHQSIVSWGLRHHAAFTGILKSSAVVAGELGGCLAVVFATMALILFEEDQPPKNWRQLLQLAATLALFELLFWGAAVYKVVAVQGALGVWRLLWLPLTPGAYVLLIMTTIDSLVLPPELSSLKASRYRHKKA